MLVTVAMTTTFFLSYLANFMTWGQSFELCGPFFHPLKLRNEGRKFEFLWNLKSFDSKLPSIHLLKRLIIDSRNQPELLDPTTVSQIPVGMSEEEPTCNAYMNTTQVTANSKAMSLNQWSCRWQ